MLTSFGTTDNLQTASERTLQDKYLEEVNSTQKKKVAWGEENIHQRLKCASNSEGF
jgi:hypothetical protein